MVSSRNVNSSWSPPWHYAGEPRALLVSESRPEGIRCNLSPPDSWSAAPHLAAFLDARLRTLADAELLSEANYLYLVLRRLPSPDDEPDEIGEHTPIAEFGYGGPPTSSEDWPLVELNTLLESALRFLRAPAAS